MFKGIRECQLDEILSAYSKEERHLSNGPSKNDSTFYCSTASCFPHTRILSPFVLGMYQPIENMCWTNNL